MKEMMDPIVLDVYKIREAIAKEYATFKNYHEYLCKERQRLETQGIQFVDINKMLEEKRTAGEDENTYEYDIENSNDSIVAEVRRNREKILEEFGGNMEAYHKYLQAQHSRWEAEGFRFVSHEEVLRRQKPEESIKTAETL
jgi:hypothetical protein